MQRKEFDYSQAVQDFIDNRPVWKQITGTILKEICPDKNNWFAAVFSLILSGVLAYIVGTSVHTVSLAHDICSTLLDVQIAIFGCIFAVYSILLAFWSDGYIEELLHIPFKSETNYLRKSTQYYEAALYMYSVAIGISLVYKLLIQCMPPDYTLGNNAVVNEVLAIALLFVYFLYSIRTLYELKSIVWNTILLFRTSLQFKIIEFQKQEIEELDDSKETEE